MKKESKMLKTLTLTLFCLLVLLINTNAQTKPVIVNDKQDALQIPKKSNPRPANGEPKNTSGEPFDKASVETMKQQCVKLETGAGLIELELFPESAPETVRNFLNLGATGAFDTTNFSRVVPGFIVQGGNLSTREKITSEITSRSRRTIRDEPSLIRHERGIVSMARPEKPDSATTHFFILVGDAPHLDGTFAAFGRVVRGMDVADAINKMPVEAEKPTKPVRLHRAIVAQCTTQTESKTVN